MINKIDQTFTVNFYPDTIYDELVNFVGNFENKMLHKIEHDADFGDITKTDIDEILISSTLDMYDISLPNDKLLKEFFIELIDEPAMVCLLNEVSYYEEIPFSDMVKIYEVMFNTVRLCNPLIHIHPECIAANSDYSYQFYHGYTRPVRKDRVRRKDDLRINIEITINKHTRKIHLHNVGNAENKTINPYLLRAALREIWSNDEDLINIEFPMKVHAYDLYEMTSDWVITKDVSKLLYAKELKNGERYNTFTVLI